MNLATGLLVVGPYVTGGTWGSMVAIARIWLSGGEGRWDSDWGGPWPRRMVSLCFKLGRSWWFGGMSEHFRVLR